MLEIFRLQIRAMLGGKKKWLVLLFLVLPVLLTYLTANFGGLGELREGQAHPHSNQPPSPSELPGERITHLDEPLVEAGGRLVVTTEGVALWRERPLEEGEWYQIDRGYITARWDGVWMDPSRRRDLRRERQSISHHVPNDEVDLEVAIDDIFLFTVTVYLFFLYPLAIVLLLALLYGATMLGSELEDRTLTYLFTRPVPRWKVIAGKYLAIVAALAPPLCLSLVLSWTLLWGVGGLALLGALQVAALGGLLAYNALFALLSFLIPQRAMILALLYSVIFEIALSLVPAVVNKLTVTFYLRSLVTNISDLGEKLEGVKEVRRMAGDASSATALAVLAGVVLVSLALASLLASRREYSVAEQA